MQVSAQSILFPQEYIFEQVKKDMVLNGYRYKPAVHVHGPDSISQSEYSVMVPDPNANPYHGSIYPNNERQLEVFDEPLPMQKFRKSWIERKLFHEHLIDFRRKDTIAGEVTDFHILIDPLFNFQYGKTNDTTSTSSTYTNSRGILAKVELNKNLKFETAFIENQSVFISYLDANVSATKDVLGQGRWKKFKTNGYDYAMASGVVWWKPSKYFELYAGHGKQKVGNGYRSLLLSDQAFNYPYARFDLNFDKVGLKYTSTYALLMNLTPTANANPVSYTPFGTEVLLQKKPFSYQYLSWTPQKWISAGLFQGMIWAPSDARNKLDMTGNFFNPVMFVNPAVYGFQWYPKILMGLNLDVKVTPKFHLYAQVATDGKKPAYNDQTGFGMQAGFKAYDAFTLKNFFLQGEYNTYRNNLYYANSSLSVSNYTHYNRFLTLPNYAANGNELVGIAAYRYKRMMVNAKANFLMYYNDIKEAYYITSFDARLSCIVNYSTNMNISAGMQLRNHNFTLHDEPLGKGVFNQMLYISFRTSLYNIYTDF
jgi:hypothetical protein